MTAGLARLIREHVAYWLQLLERGVAVVFGPAADPQGGYGIGIIELPEQEPPEAISAGDPAVKAGAGIRAEILAMPALMAGNDYPGPGPFTLSTLAPVSKT